MGRNIRAVKAKETINILDNDKSYIVNGNQYDISHALNRSVENAEFFAQTASDLWEYTSASQQPSFTTTFEVVNESTVTSLRRFASQISSDERLGVLNFASAKNPGGGFLGGAIAQEEALAVSSGLYSTLIKFQKEYYSYNKNRSPRGFYSDHMIYSPDVPFFRDDSLQLFGPPVVADVITCPAVNAGVFHGERKDEVATVMKKRIAKILHLFLQKGCTHIILGAYGCGVFRNSTSMVSQIFADLLKEDGYFQHRFKHVHFAILYRDDNFLTPFRTNFQSSLTSSETIR